MIAGEPPLGIGCRSGMVLRKSFFIFFLLRRPRPTLRLFLSPFLLLPATLLLLHPLLYSSNPNSNSLPVCQSSIRFWTQFDPAR